MNKTDIGLIHKRIRKLRYVSTELCSRHMSNGFGTIKTTGLDLDQRAHACMER